MPKYDEGALLGEGISRRVFALSEDYVLKIGKPGNGIWNGLAGNLEEWNGYHGAAPEIREWLCPPVAVASNGAWLIARRAQRPHGWEAQDEVHKAIGHLVKDLHGGNIGILDGHAVAIDYGFGVAK